MVAVTYRTYCTMHKVDIIVSAEIPGSVHVIALDPAGIEVPVTPELWADSYVSAMCRDIQGIGEGPIYPCMKVWRLSS